MRALVKKKRRRRRRRRKVRAKKVRTRMMRKGVGMGMRKGQRRKVIDTLGSKGFEGQVHREHQKKTK
jgi:hypothetical protein